MYKKIDQATKAWRKSNSVGYRQALMAYSAYYCLDGIADDLNDADLERMPMPRGEMVGYASRTGTKKNLDALRQAGWRLIVSARGTLRHEGFNYAIDNGAWTSFQEGTEFDESAFMRAIDRLGENADWVVLPDIVAGGIRSLDFSLKWLDRLKHFPRPLLLAVQDGMQVDDVREYLSPGIGIFIGGSTEWKEKTAMTWGQLARRRNCYLHVGRVNSQRRIAICAAAGANSFDGTSVTRYAKNLETLDKSLRCKDLYPATSQWTSI